MGDSTHKNAEDKAESDNYNSQNGITVQGSDSEVSPKKRHNVFSKTWGHFFDFFMLFLAVFCGFMADNWREQISEHQREKTYIRSIIEDIKSDTLESGKIITRLKAIHEGIDSVLIALTSKEIMENSNKVYYIWTRNLGLEVFISNDRTIEQLKNSEDLRLIRNSTVSDGIMKYDQAIKKYATQSNMMYNAMTNMTYYSQLFDFIKLYKNPAVPVPLTEQGKRNLNQAFSHLDLWNRALLGLISWLETVHGDGNDLLDLIKKEYKLN